MARPVKYNIEEALQVSAETFSQLGYEGTSISNLVEATKMKRGSLYSAFGSKSELFSRSFVFVFENIDKNTALTTDLLIVALKERAAKDATVSDICELIIKKLENIYTEPISEHVMNRLLNQANITQTKDYHGKNYR